MINNIIQRYTSMDNKVIRLCIFPLICIIFVLLHTNQSSSQSMASILLLLSPVAFFYPKAKAIFEYKELRLLFALIFTYFLYNFFILTQYSFSQLSLSSYRALFFWLLLPFSLIFITIRKPSIQTIALFFLLAAICSVYPIIVDYFQNTRRGQSSVHAIFWGNISLCSAMISFTLRKVFNNRYLHILSYIALILGLIASFWSLTRGGWISIPLSLLCLYFCKAITKKHLSVFSLILILLVLLIPGVNERFLGTFKSINISWSDFSIILDNSTQDRLDMWKTAVTLINENPITGKGFSAYSDRVQEIRKSGQNPNNVKNYKMPHNEFVHLLVSGGSLSLFLFLSIIIILLRIFKSFYHSPPFRVAGYLLIIQFLIFSISEVFFSTKITLVYFCIAAAMIIYAGTSEQEKNARKE